MIYVRPSQPFTRPGSRAHLVRAGERDEEGFRVFRVLCGLRLLRLRNEVELAPTLDVCQRCADAGPNEQPSRVAAESPSFPAGGGTTGAVIPPATTAEGAR